MSKLPIERFPLNNSFVYHTLGAPEYKEASCTQEFLQYIHSIGPIIEKNISKNISRHIHNYIPNDKANDKFMRSIVQCINLNLTPEKAAELFPQLMDQEFTLQVEEGEATIPTKLRGRELYEEVYEKYKH